MQGFVLKEIYNNNIEKEIKDIGFDLSYAEFAVNKFRYKNLKIFNLTSAQANIIKQTALSVGADCATHRDVITGNIEISDCILGGSFSQLSKISKKLQHQPFGLKKLGELITDKISSKNLSFKSLPTKIMGILNVTPDSFSDGGKYFETNDAIERFNELISEGADIIDIGAESTKPGSHPVSVENQLTKIIPILEYAKNSNIEIPISIDTRSAQVAQKCIELGAKIINDVSGFDYDPHLADIVAKSGVMVVLQHSKGTPDVMQNSFEYNNLMDDIYKNLKYKVDFAISKGVKKENIIIDPGIGFGKTREHNLEIIKRWKELKTIGCPVLIGLSRKSFLNLSQAENEEKDIYSLAFNSILMNEGIDYLRVHNVRIHKIFQAMIG